MSQILPNINFVIIYFYIIKFLLYNPAKRLIILSVNLYICEIEEHKVSNNKNKKEQRSKKKEEISVLNVENFQ